MQRGTRKGTPRDWNGVPNIEFLIERAEPKRQKAKKDTKRWCGGHVGREHIPWWDNHYWEWSGYREPREVHISQTKICMTCKKHLGWRSTTFQIINGVWTPKKGRW